ncbi:hypothetical protein ABS768_05195 [Flavobacterium sp. ST-75]|uniref:DUF4421 domain-containing protein n=1 Tax=Flavobacterium rhizophilum TaxID=3163296 RepID=A0ABW8YA88_9FLAO
MKRSLLLFSSAFLCLFANAQEQDEIKKGFQRELADRFPSFRIIDLQYQQYLPSDFNSELYKQDYQEGTLQNHSRLKLAVNLPVIRKPKWNITTSLNYTYESLTVNNLTNTGTYNGPVDNNTSDFHYLAGALSFTYFSKMFNKPFIYNASVFVDGSEQSAERVKGFVGGTIVLKRNARTTISTGLLVFIDPASPVPVAPVFTLEHKFENSQWVFDCFLPNRLLFRHPLFKNCRILLGSELTSNGFYYYPNRSGFAQVYDYRQLEVKTGFTYETILNHQFIAYFKGGLSNVFNSRFTERGKVTSKYILSTQQNATGYFNVGISFNPFAKKPEKRD